MPFAAEHINILLLDISKRYHEALRQADIQAASVGDDSLKILSNHSSNGQMNNPICKHGTESKAEVVRKEGKNKGRRFYCCSHARSEQCGYFQWADQVDLTTNQVNGAISKRGRIPKLKTPNDIVDYLKGKSIMFYHSCVMLAKDQSNMFISHKVSFQCICLMITWWLHDTSYLTLRDT